MIQVGYSYITIPLTETGTLSINGEGLVTTDWGAEGYMNAGKSVMVLTSTEEGVEHLYLAIKAHSYGEGSGLGDLFDEEDYWHFYPARLSLY